MAKTNVRGAQIADGANGVDLAVDVTGTLLAANGGTGLSAPGTSGNVLTSNGTAWTTAAAPTAADLSGVITKGVRYASPWWNSTTFDALGVSGWTVTGTATAAAWAATNYYTSTRHMDHLVPVASTSAVAGWKDTATASLWRGNAAGLGGFKYISRGGPATGVLSTSRFFMGLAASTAAPTDVNPSTLVSMIGVGYDAADTTLQIMHNDAAGTATKVNTGLTRVNTDRTKVYTLTISCLPNASTVDVTITDDTPGGSTFSTTISSADLPANNIALTPRGYCSVGGVSSVIGYGFFGFYGETAD